MPPTAESFGASVVVYFGDPHTYFRHVMRDKAAITIDVGASCASAEEQHVE